VQGALQGSESAEGKGKSFLFQLTSENIKYLGRILAAEEEKKGNAERKSGKIKILKGGNPPLLEIRQGILLPQTNSILAHEF